jgi:hypothetical protein
MPTKTKFPKADPAIVPVEGPAQQSGERGGLAQGLPSGEAGREAPRRFAPRDDNENQKRTTAIDDSSASGAASDYGANNEQLPERLQEALRRLVFQFSTESEVARRQEIRRIKQAHQFWRGLQYLWWDERDQNWHLPFEQKLMDNSSIEDLPRY